MKKRLLLIAIIILVLLSLNVNAATRKTLYSDTVRDRTTVKVGDTDLSLTTSQSGAYISYAGHNFVVKEGKCETDKPFTVCTSEIKPEFYAVITIYAEVAELKLGKKLETEVENLGVGDVVRVKLTVSNQGTSPAQFNLADDTTGFVVLDTDSDCKSIGNAIIMNYSVREETSISCGYRMKAEKAGDIKLKAKLNYFDGFEKKEETASLTFNVGKNDVEVNIESDKSNYDLSDKGEITLKVKNNLKDKVTIDKIEVIYGAIKKIEYPEKFKQNAGTLILTYDQLDKDQEKTYTFAFNITKIQNEIRIITSYTGVGIRKDELKKFQFQVTKASPQATLERQDKKIKIHITNPTKTTFAKIKAKVRSNYQNLNVEREIDYLFPGEKRIVEVNLEETPKIDVKYPIFISIDYETEYAEKLAYSRTLQLNFATKQQIQETGVDTSTNGTNTNTIKFKEETTFELSKPMKITAIVLGSLVILTALAFFGALLYKKHKMKKEFSKKMKDVSLKEKPAENIKQEKKG